MRELACIILAAGQGTRMHSSLPKVLHEVAGLSMLGHVLAAAKQLGAMQNIVVASPANAEALKQAVGDVTIAIQDQQLGTGHAVMAGSTTLNNKQADRLILYGDTPLLTLETLQKMVDAQKQHNAAVVVAGFRYVGPTAYGRIVCDAQGFGKKIVEYIDATEEERANNLCNGGLMLLAGDVADALLSKIQKNKRKHEYYLTDIVALATEMGRKTAVVECDEEEVLGVNNRLELSEAEALMQRRLRRQAMLAGVTMQDPGSTFLSYDTHFAPDVVLGPHVVFRPGVRVAGGVLIKAFCHLEGVEIAEGAVIGPFARLRPGTKVGENSHIGNFVELKNAHIGKGAKLNHLTYAGDAEIGAGANIGAGTITCNYDGVKKSKTVVGEGAFIGSNSSLVAPVTVGAGAFVGAGSVITNDVPPETLAVARGRQVNIAEWSKRFRKK